jgi:hypothetical protein
MMNAIFKPPLATRFYDDHVLYQVTPTSGMPPSGRGNEAKSAKWSSACYIHAGLSSSGPLRIKDVRATVERFPYLTEGRNGDVDVMRLA